MITKNKTRCGWVSDHPLYIHYHDHEWGVPIFDETLLFECLILEGMQAGLSWLTILKRRENYRASFDQFDAECIAQYDQGKVDELLLDAGIIRNKLKIQSIITNAKIFLEMKKNGIDFSEYLWSFVGGKPIHNHWEGLKSLPPTTEISDRLSKDLKKRGFKFVGSTICYAFMQAVGMVNDHALDCFCYAKNADTHG